MTALERIATLKAEILDRQRAINEIQANCAHDWKPSNPASPMSSSPKCALCGDVGQGWWCEESPTKECNYMRAAGRGYNPDSCRYCGQPSERK